MNFQVSETRYHRLFTLGMIICASLGGILYGYDIGVISGALLFIHHTIPMTREQTGFIVGAVLAGGLIGTLLTGFYADRYGRRKMVLLACVVFVLGIFTILIAKNFSMLLIARLLLGVGVGIVSVAIPLYLTEIAPAKIRGRSVTLFQLFLTFGILLAYLVDLYFTASGNWRGMFVVILIPTGCLFLGMLFLPETPRWLIMQGQRLAANRVLLRTRPSGIAKIELRAILASFEVEKISWRFLFSKQYLFPFLVAVSIAILNQLTGINILLQYAPLVVEKAGLQSHIGTMLCTVGMGAVNLAGTVIALFFIDYIGRRRLLLAGTAGIVISYLYLACLSHYFPVSRLQAELSLIGLFGYIISFAIGPGVVVWLAIAELLPTSIRGKAVGVCLFMNSLSAAVLSTGFLMIVHGIGISGTYGIFALFTGIYFLIALFFLPETKGKTLEEIQRFFGCYTHIHSTSKCEIEIS